MVKISVIIPIYNVEKFLNRCIESVLKQTYSELEILLVDDGSTDKSGAICDYFAGIDSRIRVIHKRNGGLSDARNVGLAACTGKLVMFVDSDDYIVQDCIAYMKNIMDLQNADIVSAEFTHEENKLSISNANEKIKVYSNTKEILELLLYQRISTSANVKLYKMSLFNDIRFPKGTLYEDVITIFQVFSKCERLAHSNLNKYFYFVRNNSIVRSEFNSRKMDYIYNCEKILNQAENSYVELIPAAQSRLLWACFHIWVNINDRKKYREEYEKVLDIIKKYRKAVFLNKKVQLKNKIVIVLSYFGWKVSRNVYCYITKQNRG